MKVRSLSFTVVTQPRPALIASRIAASTSSHHLCRPLQSSARSLQQRHDEGSAHATAPPSSSVDEAHIDPESIQGRMIKALLQKYSPPTAYPHRPTLTNVAPPSPPPPPGPVLPTTPDQAEEVVSQVVAVSLAHAEQLGAAQAAVTASLPHVDGQSDSATATANHAASLPPPSIEVHVAAPPGRFEEGRFLEKTPNGKPWLAQYVRPAHAGSRGGEGPGGSGAPAVYYGKLLQATGASRSSLKSTSQRLKDLGVNPASLPLDDAKAMRAVREGIRRFEKAGRVYGAKYGALEYRTRKLTTKEVEELQAEIEAESRKSRARRLEGEEDDLEGDGDPGFSTTMSRNLPESVDSSRAPGGGSGGRGSSMSVRRWTSIADERIEAARAAGFFKENKLRGKPLQQDIDERNPYIGKEEFLMNRMVKRQGASPPWVELNNTFYTHLDKFRSKILDSYSRKAVRSLTQSGALASSGGPGTGTQGTDEQRRDYFVSLAQSYRDGGEWQAREKGYHEEAIKQMNDDLKRHNFLCPPSARRGMLTRQEELQRCYEESVAVIASGLEQTWQEMTGRKARRGGDNGPSLQGSAFGSSTRPTFDVWGNPIEDHLGSASRKGWTLTSLLSRADDEGSALRRPGGAAGADREDGAVVAQGGEVSARRRAEDVGAPFLGESIVRRIKAWLLPGEKPASSSSSEGSEARR